MTTIFAIAGWILVSTVCTPLIGHVLHTLDAASMRTVPHAEARATLSPARRDGFRRRPAVNAWPRKSFGQSRPG
jgi:hypothetical protein